MKTLRNILVDELLAKELTLRASGLVGSAFAKAREKLIEQAKEDIIKLFEGCVPSYILEEEPFGWADGLSLAEIYNTSISEMKANMKKVEHHE